MKQRSKVAMTVVLGGIGLAAAIAVPAFAATADVHGNASTALQYVGNFTKKTTGDVNINYNNGIGAGGNNNLLLRLCKASNHDCSAFDTRYLTTTGQTYNLGRSVLVRTNFTVQYRAASDPGLNPYWQGDLDY